VRQIKLRAWHPEWQEMVFADYSPQFSKREFYPFEFMVGFSHYPQDEGWILMQWTGLIDKKGKDIYEGDIVICHPENKYGRRLIELDLYNGFNNGDGGNFEVIGNIHETPELLNQ
jgi:uncharacterized phage protein (TIGR01671 family)